MVETLIPRKEFELEVGDLPEIITTKFSSALLRVVSHGSNRNGTGSGSKATILWRVSDGGTQALMNAFYEALQGGNITKAEALRQAQIALITGDYTALGEERGSIVVEYIGNNLPKSVQERLSHPYYWAPFILIGNGL